MQKNIILIMFALALVGVYDAGYLTIEHYKNVIPPCSVGTFADCGRVLRSPYAIVFGIPLALYGLAHYLVLAGAVALYLRTKSPKVSYWLLVQSLGGFLFSVYLMYLQLGVIDALCLYCTASAITSTVLFILIQRAFYHERKQMVILVFGLVYRTIFKPVVFLFDAERVHKTIVFIGEFFGGSVLVRPIVQYLFTMHHPTLSQTKMGITFKHPVGLAAGFDYDAQLTQTLEPWGFGFQTIGTITHMPYEGNAPPRLGRLPKSKSLMVNKGFKNLGADATIKKLTGLRFLLPVGISIGRTNSHSPMSQSESVADIVSAFKKFEQSNLPHSYYELNISCPNLHGDVSFYPPENLRTLLTAIDTLNLSKPILVKMPIEKSDDETLTLLEVISHHSPKGVIFGNLQKNRKDPSFDETEVTKWDKGNFSGKPTFIRSNELIKLAYQTYGKRFVIVGCGGIFSAKDAYIKIRLGASLLQLITGMIFQGPQLIAEINNGLTELLHYDGFKNVSQAVGVDNPTSQK